MPLLWSIDFKFQAIRRTDDTVFVRRLQPLFDLDIFMSIFERVMTLQITFRALLNQAFQVYVLATVKATELETICGNLWMMS